MEYMLSELCEHVMTAHGAERPVYIRGGGTRDFYGEPCPADPEGPAVLDMSGYKGIVNYQPSELVITARAGTTLEEIEAVLHAEGQMLAFEPPRFGAGSTLGGAVASGLSGPRRVAAGPLRDFVQGAKLLEASGEVLSFGGEVMKNVAGFDISRLLAGSMGIFGALTEVSLKVLPLPQGEQTQVLEVDQAQALDLFNQWRSQPLPISASCWLGQADLASIVSPDAERDTANGDAPSFQRQGCLLLRLSGSDPAVAAAARKIGGTVLAAPQAATFWTALRDQTLPFFGHRPLWRIAVPPRTPALDFGHTMLEWNGGLRWVAGPAKLAAQPGNGPRDGGLRDAVARHHGHATLYRYEERPAGVTVFHPLAPALRNITRRLKQELDPVGIFNPGRLYPDF
ncbi:glycolate oxidase subunit GlcE [Allopusillimonas soli]|uniref:Glycolate oxidase subunit GlcE n=1 Tax=Allopusillimonas soli TaxID=659016 RepID=A0A853FF14_9BURK|nr:glycolate oxidase subunit GlcE [Allopusillimonas soli]NYT37101.1 glycolate oxidase subunit GlcE [Allopusillimonas soli]TEA75534.1 glycolate oxidase subunit GlcE [Allopusillimonas soli]